MLNDLKSFLNEVIWTTASPASSKEREASTILAVAPKTGQTGTVSSKSIFGECGAAVPEIRAWPGNQPMCRLAEPKSKIGPSHASGRSLEAWRPGGLEAWRLGPAWTEFPAHGSGGRGLAQKRTSPKGFCSAAPPEAKAPSEVHRLQTASI